MICGEGPHDVGRIDQWSIKSNAMIVQEGWLQPLLRKYAQEDIEFEIVPRARLVKLPGPAKSPLPQGHGTKAFLAKFRASNSAFDAVVFMVDADTFEESEWAQKLKEVSEGFSRVECNTVAIACIPKSTSESWLMADSAAWASLSETKVKMPKDPENLWGKRDDPDSDHPHCYFSRMCDDAGVEDNTETRHLLMEAATVDHLKSKCPVSFQAFDNQASELSRA